MRVIAYENGRLITDERDALTSGASLLMLIDGTGSRVIRGGVFYIDGQMAAPGEYRLMTDGGNAMVVTVDENGMATYTVEWGGEKDA